MSKKLDFFNVTDMVDFLSKKNKTKYEKQKSNVTKNQSKKKKRKKISEQSRKRNRK